MRRTGDAGSAGFSGAVAVPVPQKRALQQVSGGSVGGAAEEQGAGGDGGGASGGSGPAVEGLGAMERFKRSKGGE